MTLNNLGQSVDKNPLKDILKRKLNRIPIQLQCGNSIDHVQEEREKERHEYMPFQIRIEQNDLAMEM